MVNDADPSPSPHDAEMAIFDALIAIADQPPPGSGGQFTAVNDGSWFDASTWAGGRVPGADAFVVIAEGVEVTYDGESGTALAMVRVDGALTFATDTDTRMVVDTLAVNEGGSLTIGTAADAVDADVRADIVFEDSRLIDRIDDVAGDLDNDPTQLSLGLISHGAVSIHGAEKTAHAKVATDPQRGANTIVLEDAPTGWRVGDTIVVTGTHYVDPPRNADPLDVAGTYVTQDETFTITAIAGDRITLSGPLRYDHDTPDPSFKATVANMTRNVEFRSAEPDELATRGHTMFMHTNQVEIQNAAFTDLGRTDKSRDLDDFVLADDGTSEDFREKADGRDVWVKTDPADVTNIRGRYALHLHRTGTEPGEGVAILEGNVVSGTPGWGIVQHASGAILRENIAYGNFGAGFVTETGNETGAWIDNLAIKTAGRTPLPGVEDGEIELEKDQGRNQDFGVTGTGFWFQGRIVAAVDNVAVSSAGAGYFFLHRGVDDIPVDTDNLERPEIANGLDNYDGNRPALELFTGNEAYAGTTGVIIVGDEAPRVYNDDRSVIDDFSAWEFGNHGVHIQYSAHYTLTGLRLYGSTSPGADPSIGVKIGVSLEDVVVTDSFIANVRSGIYTRDNFTDATQIGFWGRIDQNRVDRITDFGNRYINLDFENVENNYDGRKQIAGEIFKPIKPIVLNGQTLPNLPLTLRLDDGSLKTAWGSIGGTALNGAWLSGTKTDTLGTLSFPAYDELIYISKNAIDGLTVEFGYFTVGARRFVLLDTLYSDRLTAESDILTHTLELAADWVLPTGARSLGALPDITSATYFTLVFRDNDPTLRLRSENDVYYAPGLRNGALPDTVMVRGTALADTLNGDGAPDLLLGNNAADTLTGNGGNDTLIGGDGDDTVAGDVGDDHVHGDAGDDALAGGDGDDTVTGDQGRDTVRGSAGSDTLAGGDGDDLLVGDEDAAGGGDDRLSGDAGEDTLEGAVGDDTLLGGGGADGLSGDDGDDELEGGTEGDRLAGDDGDDVLLGQDGDDTLEGGNGDDRLDAGAGLDVLSFANATAGVNASLATARATGMGDDTLAGFERIGGSDFADTLAGDAANNTLAGANGADVLDGGSGNDLLDGGAGFDVASYANANGFVVVSLLAPGTQIATRAAGNDTLVGVEGLIGSRFDDTLAGDAGANLLSGGAGNDRLTSNGDADTIDGGLGRDVADYSNLGARLVVVQRANGTGSVGAGVLNGIEEVWGSRVGDRFTSDAGGHAFRGFGGNDIAEGGGGADTLDGGEGIDTLSFANARAGVTVSWLANTAAVAGIAGVAATKDFEVLVGSAFNDWLTGGNGADTIRGGGGGDTITGGDGNDSLDGGDGNDVLIGQGNGNDTLAGGNGFDTASFANAAQGVNVTIKAGVQAIGAGRTLLLTDIEALAGSNRSDTLAGDDRDNALSGAGLDDMLVGGGGNDTLEGGASADTLIGGAGNDLFVFGAGAGTDEIRDFDAGDRISLIGFGGAVNSLAEALSDARQLGGTAQLRMNDPDGSGTVTINLIGVDLRSLDAADFLFG